jgi:diguanylate cyclase (GGDEF)-like protein
MPEEITTQPEQQPGASTRKRVFRIVSLVLWAGVLVYQGFTAAMDPTPINVVMTAGFLLLFAAVNAQLFAARVAGRRNWQSAMTRLHGSAYLSELDNLPNRNYLLSELRREMPRARTVGVPFVLIILSLDNFEGVVARQGDEFGKRAVRGLAEVLKRFTRTSDFVAHLGGPEFCVMLNECKHEDSFIYLQRVPGTIAVSDGRRMLEVPVAARMHQYDLEGLYATDVLRDTEEARPLRRKIEPRFGSEAA